jgi:hypothetical protein
MKTLEHPSKTVKLLATVTLGVIMVAIGAFIALSLGELLHDTFGSVFKYIRS